MVQHSQVNYLEAQIRECYGRVVWSHKTHEKCADILLSRNNIIKIMQIVLNVLITTGILVAIFGNSNVIGIITALLSAISLGLSSYVKNYDLGEIAQKHSEAASHLWNVREKYLSMLTDIKSKAKNISQLMEQREILQAELHSIYSGSPRTISKAYTIASKALKDNEELTFNDAEIDKILPKELRKTIVGQG